MSRTMCLARWTVERTLRSMIRSSSSSEVSVANAPPAPTPALSATAATGLPSAWIRAYSTSTPSSVARSTWTASTPAPRPSSSVAADWISASSAAMTRSNPLEANCLASSRPMPLEAPVTTARGRREESLMPAPLPRDAAPEPASGRREQLVGGRVVVAQRARPGGHPLDRGAVERPRAAGARADRTRQRPLGSEHDEVAAGGPRTGDEPDGGECPEQGGGLRPQQAQRRGVDDVERVDAPRAPDAADLGEPLRGREVPRHRSAAERVADHEIGRSARALAQRDARVADDDAERRRGPQSEALPSKVDEVTVELEDL